MSRKSQKQRNRARHDYCEGCGCAIAKATGLIRLTRCNECNKCVRLSDLLGDGLGANDTGEIS